MPSSWKPEDKAKAIQLLIENMGSTYRVSQSINIPERTLQAWKKEFTGVNTVLEQREPEDSLERVVHARYERLRNDLLEHVDKLSDQLRANPAQASDLAISMTRLIDRLHKLEALLENRHFSIIVLYEQPDGTVQENLTLAEAVRQVLKKK